MDTKYILVALRKIEWKDKKTNEEQSCYAYTSSNSASATVFGSRVSASLTIKVGGERINEPQSQVTLWLNDMSDEEYDLYEESGNLNAYIGITGDLANPTSSKVITTDEFNALQSPQMLFQTA